MHIYALLPFDIHHMRVYKKNDHQETIQSMFSHKLHLIHINLS